MIHQHCFYKLAMITFTTIAFYPNRINAQIVPDATLPNNSSVIQQDNIQVIQDGTQAGSNLFHSFEQFSVPTGSTAYFNNIANIQNIITRITDNDISQIDGTIRANGTANLFLINPSGIIFGNNASLNIGGSFLATTASSINFPDGTKFSATQPQTTPLLTINIPTGLQFGATTAPIRNQSQASVNGATNFFGQAAGLQVPRGKTLALIGGNLTLDGGNLSADSGRIELGSVAPNSFVNLNSTDKGWILGYEGVENFQNIQLIRRNISDSTIGSIVDVSGEDGGGSIQVQGNSVELAGNFVLLRTATTNDTNAGDITINASKLIVRDGAQILAFSSGKGTGGNIIVNAPDSVELIGAFINQNGSTVNSGLVSATAGEGNGGNLTINTSRLLISDGARASVETSFQPGSDNSQFILATGKAGNLTVNASEFVELVGKSATNRSSTLVSKTSNSADAGKITISTKQLIVRDEAEITVSSLFPKFPPTINFVGNTSNLGNAGEINIIADSILLDNQGKLVSETDLAKGGNINLQLQDLLLMRRNSQISTNAGISQLDGDGGNITINIPDGFIIAVPNQNSDITANAFTGSGGQVNINANSILGIQSRSRDELITLLTTNNPGELNPQELLTNDITAISQQNPNLNGELNINIINGEPPRELMELPTIPVGTKISQVCKPRGGNQSEFIFTRNAGLPPLPREALGVNSPLDVDWVDKGMGRWGDGGTRGQGDNSQLSIQNPKLVLSEANVSKIQNQIIEATGWVVDENGDILLVAGKPNLKKDNFNKVGC
ncbi:MAG: filamentous hemagglutinin N-terminal domain-containing protein [Nostocales cyanobacterium 94392]|nr:filamentous hemagglutinin N-terminal domain-containing protein [Nostocales cyanobacterium 94392]